jgi:hypothetical protein
MRKERIEYIRGIINNKINNIKSESEIENLRNQIELMDRFSIIEEYDWTDKHDFIVDKIEKINE